MVRALAFTSFTAFIGRRYNSGMKRATVTFPDELAEAVHRYVRSQEARPALTAVVQAALRQYLTDRGYLRARGPLHNSPAHRGSGRHNVSRSEQSVGC